MCVAFWKGSARDASQRPPRKPGLQSSEEAWKKARRHEREGRAQEEAWASVSQVKCNARANRPGPELGWSPVLKHPTMTKGVWQQVTLSRSSFNSSRILISKHMWSGT